MQEHKSYVKKKKKKELENEGCERDLIKRTLNSARLLSWFKYDVMRRLMDSWGLGHLKGRRISGSFSFSFSLINNSFLTVSFKRGVREYIVTC